METWLSYRPEDLLLFSEATYWRTVELHNARFWPLLLVGFLAGLATLAMALRPRPWTGRAILLILAAAWGSVGWSWFWVSYATINWVASVVAAGFAVQALALASSVAGRSILAERPVDRWSLPALLALGVAVAGYPVLALVDGRPVGGAEIFGAAPDPTAIATLAVLALARPGWVPWFLAATSILWCLASWATLATLGTWEAWVPGTAIGFFVVARLLATRFGTPPAGATRLAAIRPRV